MLSHVFTFSSHISLFDSTFILPPSVSPPPLHALSRHFASHPSFVPLPSVLVSHEASSPITLAKLSARESLRPVVGVEW